MHMNYRRPLLLAELDRDATNTIAVLRRVAPNAETLFVVAHVPEPKLPWLAAAENDIDRLRRSAGGFPAVELELATELAGLSEMARDAKSDLLVVADASPAILSAATQARKALALPVLYAGSNTNGDRPVRDVLCVAIGSRARAAVDAFLRDHGDATMRVTFAAGPPRPRSPVDLVVLPRFPGPLLAANVWPAPVLVLRPLAPAVSIARPIDVPDVVEQDGVARARILFAAGVGRHEPIPDQEIAVVANGSTTFVQTQDGFAEIAAPATAQRAGIYRRTERRVEQEVRICRPGSQPLVLFDSDIDPSRLAAIRDSELLAVRMRPVRSCRSIRRAMARAGIDAAVIDASAVLDEGPALDVGDDLDAVRLARVGARMRAAGFPVAAIVHDHAQTPQTIGFAALRPSEITSATRWSADRAPIPRSFAARVEATTATRPIAGNHIAIELDNPTARRWLLDAIAAARRRIHLQVYMAADDDVGSQVEAALAAAGARGVVVRVVVDSLHGLEGSFGARNPLLERLRARPGVELRLIHPITTAPTLEDLKQRDHRKLAVIDGTLALLGGRNLSHEYYAGFDEVRLTAESMWREVPWLDGGARVEGPVVAELERSFLDAWTGAGGAPFDIDIPPSAGSTPARVVVHHGLRDAHTLDTYIALIDSATSHVNAVNGFPMTLEIQHAMLRAIRRGVRVRSVVGNLTPTHDGVLFKGPWSNARVAATDYVHSRVDAIVAAGGEGYIFAVPEQPNWQRGLGTIHPHVHAKVMTIDGRIASVGSANLDVTAGYWENELMLVVEDEPTARALEARIDEIIAGSKPIDRNDPQWLKTARRRGWFRRWPGVLSI
jgi:cardiolipin synthase A/B